MTTPSETKKIEHGSPAWERSLADLARWFCNVHQCCECGGARARGFVCPHCGDAS